MLCLKQIETIPHKGKHVFGYHELSSPSVACPYPLELSLACNTCPSSMLVERPSTLQWFRYPSIVTRSLYYFCKISSPTPRPTSLLLHLPPTSGGGSRSMVVRCIGSHSIF